MLTVGSLFSGIGGIEYGLEQTGGFQTIWQVEQDPYARHVLQRHWPGVPCHRDIRSVSAWTVARPDLLAGGFPCQDVSIAGAGAGLAGERSGLWREFYRLICELRPAYVLVENVAALVGRGLSTVLGDLASARYDAEWSVLSACALGAPHPRERLFIVAYADEIRCGRRRERTPGGGGTGWTETPQRSQVSSAAQGSTETPLRPWASKPPVRGVADGVPHRFQRFGVVGNAVAPACAELIGHMILDHYRRTI